MPSILDLLASGNGGAAPLADPGVYGGGNPYLGNPFTPNTSLIGALAARPPAPQAGAPEDGPSDVTVTAAPRASADHYPLANPALAVPTMNVQKPSFFDVLSEVFTNGTSWANAPTVVRQRMLANANLQRQPAVLNAQANAMNAYGASITDPVKRAEFFADPAAYLKNQQAIGAELAKPVVATNDQRVTSNGQTLNGAPGAFKAENGLILNDATGDVAGRYSTPQTVPLTSSLVNYTPTVGAQPNYGPNIPPGPPPNAPRLSDSVSGLIPGARITSTDRTQAQNSAVGGVPNSLHMQADQAVDFVPPKGMTLQQAAAQLNRQPGVKAIVEDAGSPNSTGPHVHVQRTGPPPGAPLLNQTGNMQVLKRAVPPTAPAWNPRTNRFEQTDAEGLVHDAGSAPFSPEKLRSDMLGNEDYKQATAGMAAYRSMISNADKMTGPSAYAMLDTFARAINPGAVARPTVIQTIEHNLGLPAQVVGGLESKFGKGNLPPEVRQQIVNAVYGFVQAHYGQAKALGDQNQAIASRLGMDPRNVVAPLDAPPVPHHIALPPKDQLQVGDTYSTPKGVLRWNGKVFTNAW